MRLKYRLVGGIMFLAVLVLADLIILTSSDFDQTWPAFAIITVFSMGLIVYIRSITKEMKRIKTKKREGKK